MNSDTDYDVAINLSRVAAAEAAETAETARALEEVRAFEAATEAAETDDALEKVQAFEAAAEVAEAIRLSLVDQNKEKEKEEEKAILLEKIMRMVSGMSLKTFRASYADTGVFHDVDTLDVLAAFEESRINKPECVSFDGYKPLCDDVSLDFGLFEKLAAPYGDILEPLRGTRFQSLCCGFNVFLSLLDYMGEKLHLSDILKMCRYLQNRDQSNYMIATAEDIISDFFEDRPLTCKILISQNRKVSEGFYLGEHESPIVMILDNTAEHFTLHLRST